jgi:hypothetical protein
MEGFGLQKMDYTQLQQLSRPKVVIPDPILFVADDHGLPQA